MKSILNTKREMIAVLVYEFASGGGFGAEVPPPSILAEGRAMRDAVCADLAQLPQVDLLVACSRDDERPAAGQPRVPAHGESAADFLRRVAPEADAVWLIAPESDGIALALARCLEVNGHALLGCTAAALALASSKSRCLHRLAEAGVRTVPTWSLCEAPLDRHETWVIKPDVGCGCEAMVRLDRALAAAQQRTARTDDGRIAQPWLAGDAMSLSLRVDHGRSELLSVNRQHIVVAEDGALSLAGISRHTDLAAPTRARLDALGATVAQAIPGLGGYVGIDFMLGEDGMPTVLEVNPRTTSAYVGLSASLGRNLAGEILACALPELAHA